MKNNNIVIQSDEIGQHMPNTNPEFFTLKELVFSQTAKDKGIDNLPDWDIVDNLKYLGSCLDEIRQAWGKPLRVTSAFRCTELNKAVGGVNNSHHKLGLAADIQPQDMKDFEAFKKFIVGYFENYSGEFSQCILEKSGKSEWVHVSFADNRRQIFKLEA